MKHAVKQIHFVGIGGAGMRGIAEVLHNLGYRISGSDQSESATTRALSKRGIRVSIGHDAAHIAGAEAVVTSSAVKGDNPEVIAARAARLVRQIVDLGLAAHWAGIAARANRVARAELARALHFEHRADHEPDHARADGAEPEHGLRRR